MPPRAKPVRRQPSSRKPAARRRADTKALAVSDPVLRQEVARSMLDSQLKFLGAILAWSPTRLLVHQQAAFWKGFAEEPEPTRADRSHPAKRKATRTAVKTRSNGAGKVSRKRPAKATPRSAQKNKRSSARA